MKKILLLLALVASMTVHARETVTLVYSWGPGDNAANFYRALVAEANKLQNQYTFLFDTKPGAGGTIAANFTTNNPTNTLWINSSAGYIRPNLYPADSHNMADFRSILPMCVSPFVISSAKYKSWKDVPTDAKLSIGSDLLCAEAVMAEATQHMLRMIMERIALLVFILIFFR